jgi:hypothetical protein
MQNRTTNCELRGQYFSSGDRSKKDMAGVKNTVGKRLSDATHAGEKFVAIPANREGRLELPE